MSSPQKPFDPVQILDERFSQAIAKAFPQAPSGGAMITSGRNPKFGDFQCNAAMSLAKTLGVPPRDVALKIVEAVDLGEIAEPLSASSVAGPGFINVILRPKALADLLVAMAQAGQSASADGSLGVEPVGAGKNIVVDLCGVNLAKQMHVGHLRSTIIGDALARVLARLGYNVKRQNHVGDWGLPIAMVTDRLITLERQGLNLQGITLDALEHHYRAAQKECDADERGLASAIKFNLGPKVLAELESQVFGAREALASAKSTLIKLQAHDPDVMRVWQRIVDVTMRECMRTCARLNTLITDQDSAGESSYAEELSGIVKDLSDRGVAVESEGALVVRVEGLEEPCIIRKSDGGYLYATTDMAAIRRRVQKFHASRVIYCVDARQGLHFKLVYAAAIRAGYANLANAQAGAGAGPPPHASLEHAAFGMMLGDDGKPFKTRSGENVKLADLIDEAVRRSGEVVKQKNPELSNQECAVIAEAVGIAAIKYADLSSDRAKDYVFNFDRMLAFEGNTGPYLLYALVRVRRIFKEAHERGVKIDHSATPSVIEKPEKDLALVLLRYPGVIKNVASSLEPHRLCGYLYDLAQAYSAFYNECHVLNAPDEPSRQGRLALCALVERVLADGLTQLGITLLDRM